MSAPTPDLGLTPEERRRFDPERPLAERVADFKRQAGDQDWTRRAIRCAVGFDDLAKTREDFADVLTGFERLFGLPADLAQRCADSAWREHEGAAGRYTLAMHERLRWLVRSGASEAALLAAAEVVDKRFGAPLSPGDLAAIGLHFGSGEAERRVIDWRTAIGRMIEAARTETSTRRRAG